MSHNPLTMPIARILRSHSGTLSEFELMQQLEFDGLALDRLEGSDGELLLFRKHFLVMNALYQLQPVFWEEGWVLQISALKIGLSPRSNLCSDQRLPSDAADQKLREYYLNWHEFEHSSDQSVQALLDDFWRRYFALDKQQQALDILGLKPGYDRASLRSQFRRLAAVHHPDKGGDADAFCQLRDAYELLSCLSG